MYACALQAGFKAPSNRTGYRQLNFSFVETHFLALIVVDSIGSSTEYRRQKQLASSVEPVFISSFGLFYGLQNLRKTEAAVHKTNTLLRKPDKAYTPLSTVYKRYGIMIIIVIKLKTLLSSSLRYVASS